MSIESWSENIIVVELQDDPAFSDDLMALSEQLDGHDDHHVVLNFASVNYVNSSNIASLLSLRKRLTAKQRRMVVCGIEPTVWGLFLVTGLDKVFEFADNVAMGLAAVQIES